MDFGIYAGDIDKTIYLRLRDSTTGLAKTGLAFNSAGAVCSYTLPLAARVAITLATQTVTGAHSDGGFVEVDATNCKGLYRLDLPDAAIASGAFTVISIEFDNVIEESMVVTLGNRPATSAELTAAGFADGFVYFDPENGNDSNPGTETSPKLSAHLAYAAATSKKIKCSPNGVNNSKFMEYFTGTMSDITLDVNGRAIDRAGNSEAFGAGENCFVYSSGSQGHVYGQYDPEFASALMFNLGTGNHFENMRLEHCKFTYVYLKNGSVKGSLRCLAGGGVNEFNNVYFTQDPSVGAPELWFQSADANKRTEIHDFWGDFELHEMHGTQVVEALGWGEITIDASCTGGTVRHTSHVKIIDNSGEAVTTELISEPTTLADSEDVYHADINLTIDEANTQDEYTVTWFRNGVRVTGGITTPLLQVIKRVDGTDLVASSAMTQIGTTGAYKSDQATTNRITNGEAVIAIATATINGAARSFTRVLGRDASS